MAYRGMWVGASMKYLGQYGTPTYRCRPGGSFTKHCTRNYYHTMSADIFPNIRSHAILYVIIFWGIYLRTSYDNILSYDVL